MMSMVSVGDHHRLLSGEMNHCKSDDQQHESNEQNSDDESGCKFFSCYSPLKICSKAAVHFL